MSGTEIKPVILYHEPGLIMTTVIICMISGDLLCTLDQTIRDNHQEILEMGNLLNMRNIPKFDDDDVRG